MCAVRHRRIRSQTCRVVSSFVRQLLVHGLLPQNRPLAPTDGKHDEFMTLCDRLAVMSSWCCTVFRGQQFTVWDGSRQKDAIPRNNRCGMALSRQCNLPAHILRLAPFDGWIRFRRKSGSQWSPSLRPVLFARLSLVATFKKTAENEQAGDHQVVNESFHIGSAPCCDPVNHDRS